MTKLFQISFFICLFSIEYLATTTLSIPVVEKSWDKANHFIAFFVLYMLIYLSFKTLNGYTKVILLMLFAIQIEIVQYFIPNRFFSLLDIIADGVGIIIALCVLKIYGKYK